LECVFPANYLTDFVDSNVKINATKQGIIQYIVGFLFFVLYFFEIGELSAMFRVVNKDVKKKKKQNLYFFVIFFCSFRFFLCLMAVPSKCSARCPASRLLCSAKRQRSCGELRIRTSLSGGAVPRARCWRRWRCLAAPQTSRSSCKN
jgi:hypothetical protein